MHTLAFMSEKLKRRLRAHREQEDTDGAFAERLLEGVATIEREFDGEQRDRLLALVDETFERPEAEPYTRLSFSPARSHPRRRYAPGGTPLHCLKRFAKWYSSEKPT